MLPSQGVIKLAHSLPVKDIFGHAATMAKTKSRGRRDQATREALGTLESRMRDAAGVVGLPGAALHPGFSTASSGAHLSGFGEEQGRSGRDAVSVRWDASFPPLRGQTSWTLRCNFDVRNPSLPPPEVVKGITHPIVFYTFDGSCLLTAVVFYSFYGKESDNHSY